MQQATPKVRVVATSDDDPWDAFLVDDDERDPQPEYGDFWPDDDENPSDALLPAVLVGEGCRC